MSDIPLGAAVEFHPLARLSRARAAQAFTQCYTGYLLPVRFSADDLRRRFQSEDVDLTASFVASTGRAVVAAAALARRPGAARVAALGIAPAFRGRGVGRGMLRKLVEQAQSRQDPAIELEVFKSNRPARRLYESEGFAVVDTLLGFARDAADPCGSPPPLARGAPTIFAQRLARDTTADFPWQLAPETLGRLGPPWEIVEDGNGTAAVVSFARPEAVDLRLVHTVPERRGRGQARRLVTRLSALGGGRPLRVAQLVPARLEPFALAVGFRRVPLDQLRMRLDLTCLATSGSPQSHG